MVGLGNVDNTSDLNKPISTATQTALNLKSNLASPTFTGTVTLPSVSFTSTPASGTGTLLAINGSNQIITTTSSINQTNTSTAGTYYLPFVASASTGAFVPLVNAGITCDPSTGLIQCDNITSTNLMQAFNMKITNLTAGAGTLRPLALDALGQVVQDNAITALQQTRTTTNATFYVPFVSSFTTGTFTPLIENKLLFNPATGLLTTNQLLIYGNANVGSLTFSTNPATGTVAFYLAIDSAGAVIRTGSAGGDAYLANTQTFTGDNTFSGIVYASRIYAQNTGAVMEYDTRSTFAHQFKVNGTVLAQIGTLGLAVNNIVNLNAVNLVINGNGSGVIVFQASGTTMATIDGYGLNVNDIQTTSAGTDLNLYASTNRRVNLWSSGGLRFSATSEGTWMPVSGQFSFYITDTAPRTATTTYYRLFGLSGTIYQDFHNTMMWRAMNLAGNAGPNAMYLRSTGLNIPLSTTTHPTLNDYELVVGDNSSGTDNSAKILIRGNTTTNLKGPSIDFTAFNSHTSPQGSIEVIDGGLWDGVLQFWLKPRSSSASAPMNQVFKQTTDGFHFYTLPQGNTSGCSYSYASQGLPNLFRLVQNQNWFFYYSGQWSVGRFLGYFDKLHDGSIVRFNAAATQYTFSVGTILSQIACYNTNTGTWYYFTQGTFFNYTGGHFCTPNVDTGYGMYAGRYELWVNGNGATDANDVIRVHVTISPT